MTKQTSESADGVVKTNATPFNNTRTRSTSNGYENGNADHSAKTLRPSHNNKHAMQMFLSFLIPIVIHFASIGIYLHPLTLAPTPSERPTNNNNKNKRINYDRKWKLVHDPTPQLDELHIQSTEHHDISGEAPWTDAWYNDYWGRPLKSPSSHKSWRPLSVWSFRFGKGGDLGRRVIGFWGKAIGGLVEWVVDNLGGRGFRNGAHLEGQDSNNVMFGGGTKLASELFVHRFVNILIHAAIVQLVGVVAMLLFSSSRGARPSNSQLATKFFSQLFFALHPVHVEAVANVANRPHLLALLFNATIVDPGVPLAGVVLLATAGLLSAETAIFQFPAIVLTMTAIRYRELSSTTTVVENNSFSENDQHNQNNDNEHESQKQSASTLLQTFISLVPRYALLVIISISYLCLRHYYDTLSIPDGLIRPAENPFYDFFTTRGRLGGRIMNYSYVLSLHIMKSLGVEIIGFSHEYGFDCIPKIQSLMDLRLLLPISLVIAFVVIFVWCWYGWGLKRQYGSIQQNDPCQMRQQQQQQQQDERIQRILLLLVFSSWMVTLFPISGILKVGTFVADRIAVASTFGTCILVGRVLAMFVFGIDDDDDITPNNESKNAKKTKTLKLMVIFMLCSSHFARRTHRRAAEWMDSVTLLESSLKSCPRSIKSNLEMSKIYSGLVPHMLDLEKARYVFYFVLIMCHL